MTAVSTTILITCLAMIAAAALLWLGYVFQKSLAGPKEKRLSLGFQIWVSAIYGAVMLILLCVGHPQYALGEIDPQWRGLTSLFAIDGIYYLYLLIAAGVKLVSDRFYKNEENRRYFAMSFYECQEQDNKPPVWGIDKRTEGLRDLTQIVSKALLILAVISMVLASVYQPVESACWYLSSGFVLALICVYEFSLYLGGELLEPNSDGVELTKPVGRMTSRYSKAARQLESTFPSAVLKTKETIETNAPLSSETTLSKMEKSSNINDLLAAAHFRSEHCGEHVNPDYLRAASDLMDQKNVLIRNPFYNDLGTYLSLPLGESLLLGRKVLVLCPGSYQGEVVKNWVGEILDQQNRFEEKWRISELNEAAPDCNIGILKYSSLYDPTVLEQNRKFFEETQYVLLLGPSQVLSISQIGLSLVADALKEGEFKPVYCILDKNLTGLKDAISHVLKVKIESDFVISDMPQVQNVMVWDALSDYQSIERFGRQVSYLGGGIELGAHAVRAGVPSVSWVSQSNSPVCDLQDAAAKGYRSITRVMKTDPTQSALREALPVITTPWAMEIQQAECLVVEDECFNPYQTASYFVSRGKEDVFVNVLSGDYFLRDYFCSNSEVFLTNPNAIPSFVPDYVRSHRNALLKLILMMREGPMTEEDVCTQLDLSKVDFDDPLIILQEMLVRYTSAAPDLFYRIDRQIPDRLSRPTVIRYIGMNDEIYQRDLNDALRNVCYVLEDEELDLNIPNTMLYSLILQKMLPGQYVNYGGRAYRIARISKENGVILSRASDQIDGRKSYRQIRKYHFPQERGRAVVSQRTIDNLVFVKEELDFTVETPAYIESTFRNIGSRHQIYDVSQSPDYEEYKRIYRNKTVLSVRFPKIDQNQLCLLAEMFEQVLPSLFPQEYPYLSIAAFDPEESSEKDHVFSHADTALPGELLVIEDSVMDLGLLDVIEEHFTDILSILQDVLLWEIENLTGSDLIWDTEEDPVHSFETISLVSDPETGEPDLIEDEDPVLEDEEVITTKEDCEEI